MPCDRAGIRLRLLRPQHAGHSIIFWLRPAKYKHAEPLRERVKPTADAAAIGMPNAEPLCSTVTR